MSLVGYTGPSREFTVKLVGDQVVVTPNGGSVRGHGGKLKIIWKLSPADVTANRTFTLDFSTMDLDDDPQGTVAESPLDDGVATVESKIEHADKLRKVPHGTSQFISKYTVTINNAPQGTVPLDPVIIVDR